ncbi:reverse transcriptase domain-containing protein [Tanacetum coccineum]
MSIPHNNQGSPLADPPPPNNNVPPPVVRPNEPAPRSIEELCKSSINGWGRPITPIPIQATDFGLRHHMIQQVQNTCQFHGLLGEDASRHIDKFFEVTQHMKQNGVSDNALRLSPFPYSLHIMLPHGDLKAITTRRGIVYDGLSVPPTLLSSSNELEQEPETLMDQVLPNNSTSVPPLVVQSSYIPSEPASTPASTEPSFAHTNPIQPSIPYPQGLKKDKQKDKSDIQLHTFLEMFKKLHFNISLAEALVLMPKYTKMMKDLFSNKEKLLELANTPLNENCSAVLLKKMTEKLGDPSQFLILCDFKKMTQCTALADLGVSINLMPLAIYKKLKLLELVHTRMTLELANGSMVHPSGNAEDVLVKVGKFTFPANFIVVDYEDNSRVPLILGRPFLRTAHALIDVHGEELILRDDDERLIFKPDGRHGKESVHMIDICDSTFEDLIQKVFHPTSGIPTPTFEPLIEFFSPSPTPSEGSDLLLGETDTLIPSYDNSLPELEAFCFDMEEKSSGSPTSLSVISLPIYEAFSFDNHTEEKSSGSTTTHSYLSLLEYDSFRFDLTDDHILPTERSDFLSEKLTDELSLIISPPEYDSFRFGNEDIVISSSSSPTHSSDSTVGFPSKSLTSFKDIDLLLEETDAFLDSIPSYIDDGIYDSESDILFLENSFKDEPSEIEESNPRTPDFVDLLLIGDSSLTNEAFENDTCLSFPSENEDKVFNPGILDYFVTNDGIFGLNFTYEESTFTPLNSDSELFLSLEEPVIDIVISFSNEDKVFNPGISIINGVHSYSMEFSLRGYDAFKLIINENLMIILPFFFFFPHGGDIVYFNVIYLHFYPP